MLENFKLHRYEEDRIFCLTLGTGIGGAFYSEASGIYQGSRHRANEIGYLLYREEDGVKHMSNVPQHQHLKI